MQRIRDLKVKKADGAEISAGYYKDEDTGVVYYKEDGSDEYQEYLGEKHGCSSCVYNLFMPKTENAIYQVRPLPSYTCKCRLINRKYSDFDITYKSDWVTCKHPVCDNFRTWMAYADWNVNQFIDVKNSCIHKSEVFIQGMSYKRHQAPFTFYVTDEEWHDLDFVKEKDGHHLVHVYCPVIWNEFAFEGKTYKGYQNYIDMNNITDDKLRKEIKEAFSLNWFECHRAYTGKWFDFDIMWFI